jgi:hypothetical protein
MYAVQSEIDFYMYAMKSPEYGELIMLLIQVTVNGSFVF